MNRGVERMGHRIDSLSLRQATRERVAADPTCPPDVLDAMGRRESNWSVLRRIAENPNTLSETLDWLARRSKHPPLAAVLIHPNTSLSTREYAADRTEWSYKLAQALVRLPGVSQAVHVALGRAGRARAPYVHMDKCNAASRSDDVKLLEVLARDEDRYVRLNVAANTHAPSDLRDAVAEELLNSADPETSALPARFPVPLTPRRIDRLLAMSHQSARFCLAERPDLRANDYMRLVNDPEPYIRRNVARNPQAPPEALRELAQRELRRYESARTKAELESSDEILGSLETNTSLAPEVRSALASRVRLRALYGLKDPLSVLESPPEEAFWAACLELGLPELAGIVPQHEVGPLRLDFALPQRRLGIEVDGLAFHGSQESFRKDRDRQRQLEMMGWRVLRFAAAEVLQDPRGCVRSTASWASAVQ